MNEMAVTMDNAVDSKKVKTLYRRIYLLVKRVFDFTTALILLILLSPVFLVLSLIIRRDGGKAIFIQKRSGKNDTIFNLYKFRSMVPNNSFDDKKSGDQITKVGHFIRKTSLDELPQLINIIKGEMSFVGPRPWVTSYSENFTPEQKRRLDVLPGLTGLAQCTGRNDMPIFEKIKKDLEYVNKISLFMDIKILFRTIATVFKKEGVIHEGTKESFHNEIEELKRQFEEK